MWTCVTVTCPDSAWATAITEELAILESQSLLNSKLSCVISADPRRTVGDGEATLNALLITHERLANVRDLRNVFLTFCCFIVLPSSTSLSFFFAVPQYR